MKLALVGPGPGLGLGLAAQQCPRPRGTNLVGGVRAARRPVRDERGGGRGRGGDCVWRGTQRGRAAVCTVTGGVGVCALLPSRSRRRAEEEAGQVRPQRTVASEAAVDVARDCTEAMEARVCHAFSDPCRSLQR